MEPDTTPGALRGPLLYLAGILLALSNFVVVLDMTITNVAVPTIAGNLGVSATQGTWTITSYAVAEAISVPLTGWLVERFGAVRMFTACLLAFGACSAACGTSDSLGHLVATRVAQGLAGGPIMPISQMLLLRIFSKEQAGSATALWAVTALMAPIAGPLVGGWICDNYHWSWIFFINVPMAAAVAALAWPLLKKFREPVRRLPIDRGGFALLVVWVGAFQILLDKGQDLDWFASPVIITLAIVSAIGFTAFVIWECTAEHPIVDLSIFRNRGFTLPTITLAAAFGGFFPSVVIGPLWLATDMNYPAAWSGQAIACGGVMTILLAPVVAFMIPKIDVRIMICSGLVGLAAVNLLRSGFTMDMNFTAIALPMVLQGAIAPFFMIPLIGLGVSNVDTSKVAAAAGMSNFVRTLSGAFSTSITTAIWSNQATRDNAELVGSLHKPETVIDALVHGGMRHATATSELASMVQSQSIMLATNQVFAGVAVILLLSAWVIWLTPRSTRTVDVTAGH